MLLLLLHFGSVYVLTAPARVSAVTTETVVGVAGRRVILPCRSEGVNLRGVEVCWGRGEPSLFTCHNTVINAAGDQVSYRRSYRYSVSSSSSLSILSTRLSDSGFYHCRVQLPGLFNDQTSTVHLIVISSRSVISHDAENLNAPRTMTSYTTTELTEERGRDVSNATEPMVSLVQSSVQTQVNSLQMFLANTVRMSFIIFIPALLVTAAYRVWGSDLRAQTDRRLDQSEKEDTSV